jgi:hypothetical protein
LPDRKLDRLFRPVGEAEPRGPPPCAGPFESARTERLVNPAAHLVEVDPDRRQRLGARRAHRRRGTGSEATVLGQELIAANSEPRQRPRSGVPLGEEREQQVLGAQNVLAEHPSLVPGALDDASTLGGQPIEHR